MSQGPANIDPSSLGEAIEGADGLSDASLIAVDGDGLAGLEIGSIGSETGILSGVVHAPFGQVGGRGATVELSAPEEMYGSGISSQAEVACASGESSVESVDGENSGGDGSDGLIVETLVSHLDGRDSGSSDTMFAADIDLIGCDHTTSLAIGGAAVPDWIAWWLAPAGTVIGNGFAGLSAPAAWVSNASGNNSGTLGDAVDAAFKSLKDGILSILDTGLSALYVGRSTDAAAVSVFTAGIETMPGGIGDVQFVTIDATAKDGNGAALLTELSAIGLRQGGSFGTMASGLLPVDQIGALLTLPDLSFVRESGSGFSAGNVTNQADHATAADTAGTTYAVDGGGITVGVLSDSFNNRGGMNADIASGDLPAGTTVLSDLSAGGTDEGRAMAQIVHDIAPGAAIVFATAFTGIANFANSIVALAQAGAKVIVDDVLYFAETAFQDGPIAQAIDQVTANGAVYFSAAGNDADNGFEAAFVASGVTGPFGESLANLTTGGNSQFLPVTIPRGATVYFVLEWNQPAQSVSGGAGTQSDVDLFLYSSGGKVVSQAISDNIGHDPVEIISYTNKGLSTAFKLAVGLYSGAAPTDFKLMALDNGAGVTLGASSRNTDSGTVYGHAAASGAIAVAAADYADTPAYGTSPPVVEPYSSEGPTRILFDIFGNALAAPDVRQTPQITAPDGGDTTFFGFDSDGNGWPNFFGTSAAAPAAAAVAALMLQANGALTAGDILNLLKDSAVDMDNPATAGFDTGFDNGTGAGLIQADKAVGYAATLTITGDANANTLFGTHLADVLDGGPGADTMIGGLGDDSYYVDNGGDVVTEAVGQGTDTVYASVDYALPAGSESEYLRANAGASGLHLTGNNLVNRIYGGSGDDTLDGGSGADYLYGGAGNDTYIVNNAGVHINEVHGGGIDTVMASVSFSLNTTASANVENLTLTGSGAINGTGNDLANTIIGNGVNNTLKGGAGNDTLVGGGGVDRLYGGSGADTFVFKAVADSTPGAHDMILDFSGVSDGGEGDRIDLTGLESSVGETFTVYADGRFHGGSGDLRAYTNSAGNTILEVDINGDKHADFQVIVTGAHTIGIPDLIL
jgi:hypothetical protein